MCQNQENRGSWNILKWIDAARNLDSSPRSASAKAHLRRRTQRPVLNEEYVTYEQYTTGWLNFSHIVKTFPMFFRCVTPGIAAVCRNAIELELHICCQGIS